MFTRLAGLLAGLLLVGAVSTVSAEKHYTFKGQELSLRLGDEQPVAGEVCDPSVQSTSGYIHVDGTKNANYFYWFFEARNSPETAPLVMWLTGGPGCASTMALLTENGPCSVNEDATGTIVNEYSWNTNANIMWVDQPANVGYSYGDKTDMVSDEEGVAEDMFWFLQEYYQAHPEYLNNEFYIFAESYGGHYAPSIAYRVLQGNLNNEGLQIPLAGMGVGNGMTAPPVQYQYYAEMANNNSYDIKAVSDDTWQKMVDRIPRCTQLADGCQDNDDVCDTAYTYCNTAETTPYYQTGLNPYDIRIPCGDSSLCYDFDNVEVWYNEESTREALHVSDEVKTWQECNNAVNAMFTGDWMKRFDEPNVVELLANDINVLIYAGDADFICNWYGNRAWVEELDWDGNAGFNAQPTNPWNVDGTEAGTVRNYENLTFLRVYAAGHMVPMDQPKNALSMLDTFISHGSFASSAQSITIGHGSYRDAVRGGTCGDVTGEFCCPAPGDDPSNCPASARASNCDAMNECCCG